MKKVITIVYVFLILNQFNTGVQAQEPQVYTDYALAEKIYLQTDGLVYTSDQTIWFKGIVVHGSDLKPSQLSGILYIDLINAFEEIVESKTLKLRSGVASGSFELDASMSSGKYQIRAYTNWNLNFGDKFTFKQYVDIYPPSILNEGAEVFTNLRIGEKAGQKKIYGEVNASLLDSLNNGKIQIYLETLAKKDSLIIKANGDSKFIFEYPIEDNSKFLSLDASTYKGQKIRKNVLLDNSSLDVQFFPEGGSLVEGIYSKVGFKAVDATGLGKRVKGEVLDEKNETVARFESNDLGMGFFSFEPKSGLEYTAIIDDRKFEFPKSQKQGIVLSLRKSADRIIVEAQSTESYDDLRLHIKAKGIIQKQLGLKLEKGQLRTVLNAEDFVEGILNFRILNGDTPLASRSYFNLRENSRVNVELNSVQPTYKQRDKGAISINLTEFDSVNSSTTASLFVLNKDELGAIQSSRNNILTHMLLTSELKGFIEDPMRYFNESNADSWDDVEALMLTQGWSKYVYKTALNLEREDLRYKPEPGLMVTGKVSSDKKGSKVKEGVGLTLATFGSQSTILNQTSNKDGRFAFQVPDEFGQQMKVLIQTTKKGNQKTFNIDLDEHAKPEVYFNQLQSIVRTKEEEVAEKVEELVVKHQERKLIEDAWRVEKGTRDLGVVIVEDYELTPEREKVKDKHGAPDVVLRGEEIRESAETKNYGLYSVLSKSFPEVVGFDRIYIFDRETGVANDSFLRARISWAKNEVNLVLVDGVPIQIEEYKYLEDLPVSEIKSFEIIKQPENFEELAFQLIGRASIPFAFINYNIISIYTYAGKGLIGTRATPGMYQGTIPVYSIEQEFYSPKYENLTKRDWLKPDKRALVHWEPNITFNNMGKAVVEFYNADSLGEMLVVVEVLTSDGKVAYKTSTFEVEEQTER